MGGLALLARDSGYRVSGSDAHVYPPMSTQLVDSGIAVMDGYDADQLAPAPDLSLWAMRCRAATQRLRAC